MAADHDNDFKTCDFKDDVGPSRVLGVIEELDDILTSLRLLTRTCEKQRLHDPAHAFELCLEIVLRRRNYILNVSSIAGTGPPYDVFPCENCSITYPTTFLLTWLDYIISSRNDSDTDDTHASSSLLCRRSCSLYFGAPRTVDHLADGVLYPMGVPYVSGPIGVAPRLVSFNVTAELPLTADRLVGECDEIDRLYATLNAVRNRLSADDRSLTEALMSLLRARRYFGFDMDCLNDADVNASRLRLSELLHAYDKRLLNESFFGRFPIARVESTTVPARPGLTDLQC